MDTVWLSEKQKQCASFITAIVMVIALPVSSLLVPKPVEAQNITGALAGGIAGCVGSMLSGYLGGLISGLFGGIGAAGGSNVPVGEVPSKPRLAETARATTYNQNKEGCIDTLAWTLAKLAIQEITASTISWINQGFEGNPSFISDPANFFLQIADSAAAQFIFGDQLAFLCSPFRTMLPQIKLSLFYKYFQTSFSRSNRSCGISDIARNFQNAPAFLSGNQTAAAAVGWDTMLAITQVPDNNMYGAALKAEVGLGIQVSGATALNKTVADWNKGFKSLSKEVSGGLAKIISTPGSFVQDQLYNVMGSDVRQLEIADELSESISAVVGALVNKLLEGGLSGITGNDSPQSYVSGLRSGNAAPYQLVHTPSNAFNANDANNLLLGGGDTSMGNADAIIAQQLLNQAQQRSRLNLYDANAAQCGTYAAGGQIYSASRALDNSDQTYAESSCSPYSWWRVDLPTAVPLDLVRIKFYPGYGLYSWTGGSRGGNGGNGGLYGGSGGGGGGRLPGGAPLGDGGSGGKGAVIIRNSSNTVVAKLTSSQNWRISSTGTYTIEAIGGGAGGQSGLTSRGGIGGTGGSFAFIEGVTLTAQSGSCGWFGNYCTISVQIGNGGNGGSNGSGGATGGDTSVSYNSTTILLAPGGGSGSGIFPATTAQAQTVGGTDGGGFTGGSAGITTPNVLGGSGGGGAAGPDAPGAASGITAVLGGFGGSGGGAANGGTASLPTGADYLGTNGGGGRDGSSGGLAGTPGTVGSHGSGGGGGNGSDTVANAGGAGGNGVEWNDVGAGGGGGGGGGTGGIGGTQTMPPRIVLTAANNDLHTITAADRSLDPNAYAGDSIEIRNIGTVTGGASITRLEIQSSPNWLIPTEVEVYRHLSPEINASNVPTSLAATTPAFNPITGPVGGTPWVTGTYYPIYSSPTTLTTNQIQVTIKNQANTVVYTTLPGSASTVPHGTPFTPVDGTTYTFDYVAYELPNLPDPNNPRSAVSSKVITVASPQQMVTVPDVVGMTQSAAVTALSTATLTSTIATAHSPTVASGRVISQNFAPGTSLANGSAVTITVSLGP